MILTHNLQRKGKKLRIFAKLGDFLFENMWSPKLGLKMRQQILMFVASRSVTLTKCKR